MKPGERPPSKGFVTANAEICSGCRTCEAVCSLHHDGAASSQRARIEVVSWPFEGYRSEVYICEQCDEPACQAACPTGALRRNEATGAVIIEETECTGCRSCLEACSRTPSRIRFDEKSATCVKCDLCGGAPVCVKYCMEGVLGFEKG